MDTQARRKAARAKRVAEDLLKVTFTYDLPPGVYDQFHALRSAAYRGDVDAASAAFDVLEEAGLTEVHYDARPVPLAVAREWVCEQ